MIRKQAPPEAVRNRPGPQAAKYVACRPRYPTALFHYLAVISGRTRLAWDCATGNGQAAVGLAERFARVVATDPSADMIANAIVHPRVTYLVTKYDTGLPAHSVNLVSVAQALHWIEIELFVLEVRRVLVPNGVLAAWCYTLCRVEPRLDEVVDQFYGATLGPFWPAERRHTQDECRSIALPFDEMVAPPMQMTEDWTLPQFLSHVWTWPGVAECVAARGEEPVRAFEEALRARWGMPMLRRTVRWSIHLRIGRLH